MRGKLACGACGRLVVRIIPAHAGQTCRPCRRTRQRADHPRACGANFVTSLLLSSRDGSSPRMRGKPEHADRGLRHGRIIPAHAGQTWQGNLCGWTRQDHPRACGANMQDLWQKTSEFGSSPRMRGKRRGQRHRGSRLRIIPAHAGQTGCPDGSLMIFSDHPRACGANSLVVEGAEFDAGSSPRMRGKLAYRCLAHAPERIIPAHAGQTAHRICSP